MKLFSSLMWHQKQLTGDGVGPGALRTKNTHKSVMPRRFRDPETRFFGRHKSIRSALSGAFLLAFIAVVHIQNAQTAAAQNRPSKTGFADVAEDTQVWTLPADRWAWEIRLRGDYGFGDLAGIEPALNAAAGMCIGFGNFIWQITRNIIGSAFNQGFIQGAAYEINELTSTVGSWLISTGIVYVIAIAVVVMAVMQSLKGATTSIFKTILGAIIPLGLLFAMTNAAISSTSAPEEDNRRPSFISPGGLLIAGIDVTNTVATTLQTGNTDSQFSALTYDSATLRVDGKEFASCKDYVGEIHQAYQSRYAINGGATAINSAISSLWERSILVPWISAQYGTNNDIGMRMFCHNLEQNADVAPVVRWYLFKRAYTVNGNLDSRAPGHRNSEGGDWNKAPAGLAPDYYSDQDVQHVNNKCKESASRDRRPEINGSGYFLPFSNGANPLPSIAGVGGGTCAVNETPENLFIFFRPPGKDEDEANWTALGMCKWKKNANVNEVFLDPGDTEFSNVRERENPAGKRAGIGLNEYQSCNQWWDFGVFSPKTIARSQGIFIYLKSEDISDATTKNGVNSDEAANYLWAMNGHTGTTALLMGFLAVISSVFYGFALIGLGLYVFLAQIQLFIALALFPMFLLAGAIPHPKGKALMKGGLKMIGLGLLAKTLAVALLTLLFLIMIILTLLLESMNLGGSFLTSLTPLIALFAIRKIPGVKGMTTVRGAIKGTKQRVGKTFKGGGGISTNPDKKGFIRNAVGQSARSFGHGLIGTSPYAARKIGNNMRQSAFDKIRKRGKRDGNKNETPQEAKDNVVDTVNRKSKKNKAPGPADGQGVAPTRVPESQTPAVDLSKLPLPPVVVKAPGPFGRALNRLRGRSIDPSYIDPETGKPKADVRKPTPEEIVHKKSQVNAVRSKTDKANDPAEKWQGHRSQYDTINKNLEQMKSPDTVTSGAPTATSHAADSSAMYADLAGGAGHQDVGRVPAADQAVFSTIDTTGQERVRQDGFANIADSIASGAGIGMGPNGMWLPGQQQQQQQSGPMFVGTSGQNPSSVVAQMNAAASKDVAKEAAASNKASKALLDAAGNLQRSVDKSTEANKLTVIQGAKSQRDATEKITKSIQDIPRK